VDGLHRMIIQHTKVVSFESKCILWPVNFACMTVNIVVSGGILKPIDEQTWLLGMTDERRKNVHFYQPQHLHLRIKRRQGHPFQQQKRNFGTAYSTFVNFGWCVCDEHVLYNHPGRIQCNPPTKWNGKDIQSPCGVHKLSMISR
jgi:hypothetical protein